MLYDLNENMNSVCIMLLKYLIELSVSCKYKVIILIIVLTCKIFYYLYGGQNVAVVMVGVDSFKSSKV